MKGVKGVLFKYVLFDLDGTLTNPEIGITNCVMYALEKFGIKVEDRKELHPFIGPPLTYSFQSFYGLSEEDSELAVKYYRERFSVKGLYENEVFDGVEKVLQELKERGKILIIATSKPEEFTLKILEYFDLLKYFDFVAGATMDGSRGEKVDVIRYAIEISGIEDKSQAIMIGDTHYDIIGAKENGLASIGVLFGFGNYEELTKAGADYIVESVEDIINYV
jgi:phosphoglycolate phosphatase